MPVLRRLRPLRPLTPGGQPLRTPLCTAVRLTFNQSHLPKVAGETEDAHAHSYDADFNIDAAFEACSQSNSPRGTPRGAIVRCRLEGKPPSSRKAPGQPQTLPAPRQLNQQAAPSNEAELAAAHPVTPLEDERDEHTRILGPTLWYVLDYLPQDHPAQELCTIAANPPPVVLRRE
ncbi:hypothetical protein MRX96_009602 [Rhipicephalus microplus]|uniref:Uncharacterized protein n=1 Tax=Rhipicephalus microplus TaxID=6941 RepID=A0A9J6DIE8_RHIMP|nr:hypothetical protein HPB51_018537 [Rhipicephalus microplus]